MNQVNAVRKGVIFFLSCLFVLLLVPTVYAAAEEGKDTRVDVADEIITMDWVKRLRWENEDKTVQIKIGGLYSFDWAQINEDSRVGSVYDPVQRHKEEVRWARPQISLKLYDRYKFRLQYEIAGKRGQIQDFWGQVKDVPYLGKIKAGHFKEPFSMTVLTGRKGSTMMEYSPASVFAQARNLGVQFENSYLDGRINAAAGVFNKCNYLDNAFTEGNSGIDLTGRVGWRPYQEDDGKKLIHVGLGYSHQFLDADKQPTSFSTSTGSHLSIIKLTGTGSIPAYGQDLMNLELAGKWDQFWFQSEYTSAYLNTKDRNNAFFSGYHFDVGYILTGESKPFKSDKAIFGAINPKEPFNPLKGGWGALEVAGQYSHTDMNDYHANVRGGVQDNIGVALNWYLNAHTRVAGNYMHVGVAGRDNSSLSNGEMDIYQCRIMFYF
ncbi:phosphate-selective porin OprO and OprP [Maridesulfovibrio ferrireducens]|uniref:Phosphate-selective porin OprO and OprP n=1 Tax=Maridesulfovibrio ferrireducens TaxID=246191 RepID=A0A1G9FE30_9BACT|nr:porin [Maridesulfovibrio ferrireducens]SDK86483.1 phosphate-selective porin OprO and OprP [Maridesulfovibrio ferrireducens]